MIYLMLMLKLQVISMGKYSGKIPIALLEKVKKFEKMLSFNVLNKLEQICDGFKISAENPPQAFDYVCPICEAFLFYIYVSVPEKNKKNITECPYCKSQSSKRTVESTNLELLFSLKHNN
jgi:rubrerythrin